MSPTLSCSVSFSLVAGMFDGWFTWLLRTQTCPWCDLSVVGVVVLLTKIPIGTNPVPLIGLGPVSNTSRQLLVKSSYWTYGKQLHHEITLYSPCVLQNECRLTGSGWLKSLLDYFNRTSKVLLSHKLTVNLPIRTALALVSNKAVFQVNVAPCDSNIRMNYLTQIYGYVMYSLACWTGTHTKKNGCNMSFVFSYTYLSHCALCVQTSLYGNITSHGPLIQDVVSNSPTQCHSRMRQLKRCVWAEHNSKPGGLHE